MRWLIVFVLTCTVWNGLQPWLSASAWAGCRRLQRAHRPPACWHFPLGSSPLITLVGLALMRWLWV